RGHHLSKTGQEGRVRAPPREAIAAPPALLERLAQEPIHQQPPEDLARLRNMLAEQGAEVGDLAPELSTQALGVQTGDVSRAARERLDVGRQRPLPVLLGLKLRPQG